MRLDRWRQRRAARRADRAAAAVATLRIALREWADDDPASRARFAGALVSELGGLWLREAAYGRLSPWFLLTDYEGLSELQLHVDREWLTAVVERGKVDGTPDELAALRRIVS
ncbi:hypothetical protein [Parafrankia sp. FMc2]|uniref:hypothetical protein n=1 Tax=Parafrankia sp. FMc2 TaxID=3233196 RepID=UPI0034D6BB0E